MPSPSSSTSNRRCTVSLSVSLAIRRTKTFPLSVNFTAFPTRLSRTCRRRDSSPIIAAGIAPSFWKRTYTPFSSALADISEAILSTNCSGSISVLCRATLSARNFDNSNTSFRSVKSAFPEWLRLSTNRVWRAFSGVPFSSSTVPMIPVSGVRISWLRIARKVDFSSLSRFSVRARKITEKIKKTIVVGIHAAAKIVPTSGLPIMPAPLRFTNTDKIRIGTQHSKNKRASLFFLNI